MANRVGQEFWRMTKYQNLETPDQQIGFPEPPREIPVKEGENTISLPDWRTVPVKPVDLIYTIANRRTVRNYSEEPITLGELSFLLFATQGLTPVPGAPPRYRAVPSAGARHPLETYLYCNRVLGLPQGIYRYVPSLHALTYHGACSVADLVKAMHGLAFVENAAVTFMWAAVAYRATYRYAARGYRMIMLDAGHVCQNLYLAVRAIDAGCCGIGIFYDDETNSLLGLDGEEQFIVYAATAGKTGT